MRVKVHEGANAPMVKHARHLGEEDRSASHNMAEVLAAFFKNPQESMNTKS